MSTKTLTKKLQTLSQEVTLLRSFIIGVIGTKDPEGVYRPEFVKKILQLAQKKQKQMKFISSTDLLKKIRK